MKVTNWRRKLATALTAGGVLSASAAQAANLDAQLLTNGDFETVNLGVTGEYNGPLVLGWTGPDLFAYAHNGNTTNPGLAYDWADGADPPGAGNWYFTPNNTGGAAFTDVHDPDTYFQDVVVSAGATGAQIATGEAIYKMSAFMSSYLNDTDFANVRLNFRNAADVSIGTATISDSDPGPANVWSLNSGVGFVPVGTANIRVSLYGTRTAGGPGADGYTDNVDVRIKAASSELMYLEVNTTNGQVRVRNETGAAVNVDYYEIRSGTVAVPGTSLNATAWNSLQEQNLPGFPAGNGSGNGWEQAGGSSSSVIGESYLTGSSAVAHSTTVGLGLGAAFNVGGAQNLVFKYGALLTAAANPVGDYNNNGTVDAADYALWRNGGPLSNDPTPGVQAADYNVWRANFGLTGGPTGPSTLTTGFVRYVPSFGAGAGALVPEPSGVILVGIGLGMLAVGGRRRTHQN